VKEIITGKEKRYRIIKEERVTEKGCLDKEIGYGWRKRMKIEPKDWQDRGYRKKKRLL